MVNRGAAFADGKVVFNTLDNQTIAVDANTGREVWKIKLGDINLGESMTMAPLIVKDKVLVGNSGGEMGVRGWLTALDLKTGKIAWRAYSTGPDKDVLIGTDFKAPYDSDNGHDLGVSTWPADVWKTGGGAVWGWLSYDPDLNLVYYGTSNPGSWNADQRPGDNKWASSIFARDPDTGYAKWAYQYNLRIGVHLIVNNSPPPALALARRGIIDNVVGYSIYGDYSEPNPPLQLVKGVAQGDIDVAVVWVPMAGYFAKDEPIPLTIVPLADNKQDKLPFDFSVSLAVRKDDKDLKMRLNAALDRNRDAIRTLLDDYHAPQMLSKKEHMQEQGLTAHPSTGSPRTA